jgi:hypothetical protein
MAAPTPDPESNSKRPRRLPSTVCSASGWDIRLQCTTCGFRVRRHRNDYPGFLGPEPKATLTTECSNCDGEQKLHFIDFAQPHEL